MDVSALHCRLIGPADRKSIQRMAERLAADDYDQLHHFVADGRLGCDAAGDEAVQFVAGDHAVLVIGDTAVPKKGKHSVGVAVHMPRARCCWQKGKLPNVGLADTCAR